MTDISKTPPIYAAKFVENMLLMPIRFKLQTSLGNKCKKYAMTKLLKRKARQNILLGKDAVLVASHAGDACRNMAVCFFLILAPDGVHCAAKEAREAGTPLLHTIGADASGEQAKRCQE